MTEFEVVLPPARQRRRVGVGCRVAAPARPGRCRCLAVNIWLGLCCVFVLFGCVAANPSSSEISYYMLEYDPPRPDNRRPLPVVLGVEDFRVAPYYNSDRILYREDAFRRNTYHYHRWRVNPGDFVTAFLIRDLRTSGRFTAVVGSGHRLATTHTIEGTVDDFYEEDASDHWHAVLSLSVTLVDESEPNRALAVLFQNNYTLSERCRQRNPRAVAEAMSGALARLSQMILTDVTEALKPRSEEKTDK